MDALFPTGFPPATALYLTLYVVTMVLHVLFMNYILAGSAYLAFVSLFTGGPQIERQREPLAMMLRDWMPVMLSGAITAGVAPLLFVQILYPKEFYTANLLLSHRWMAILPVLIVGFYLLYLLKSKRIGNWHPLVRTLVGGGAFACFAFTGYSWTENHMLSVQSQAYWSDFYARGSMLYVSADLYPRLAIWFTGSLATLAALAGWQLWYAERRGTPCPDAQTRNLAALALVGIALSIISGALYMITTSPAVRDQLTGPLAGPYMKAAIVGLIVQVIAWLIIVREGYFRTSTLATATAGLAATLVGVTVVREAIRLGSVDITALYDAHAQAATRGGLFVFLVCFLLTAGLIGFCFLTVRRGLRDESGPGTATEEK